MANPAKRFRCAIYTRKSTEEGLDKAFNSLDAQREACAAYVLSQQHEGWTLVPGFYDDGGFSGGNIERPALQQLLADVKAGLVDVVVVYKIDRLTRSLADFAKIVDVLDAAGASFVSVTQAFNTTNSMGRLTLNVLLSFAQFEREVIAERIRDKVAASKARGMWMGGGVPLGYRVEDRKLIVVPEEAATVRDIMKRCIRSDSIRELLIELRRDGIISKQRIARDGSKIGGIPFGRGALCWLLANRVYIGETRHKDKHYPGEHEAIVSRDLYDAVQARLAERTNPRAPAVAKHTISLLSGMIRDADGRPMSPVHTQNHGKRYRYYVSHPDYEIDTPVHRLPASDIDIAVRKAIAELLADTDQTRKLACDIDPARIAGFITHCRKLSGEIADRPTAEVRATLQQLCCAVRICADNIALSIGATALLQSAGNKAFDREPISIIIPSTLESWGQERRLRLDPPSGPSPLPDHHLVELIARSFAARDKLLGMSADEVSSMPVTGRRHLERIARLSYLAPNIISAILDGTQPRNLQARTLWRLSSLPLSWNEQHRALGFTAA